jgi:hypothetical protein
LEYNYIVCSGWWCNEKERDYSFGSDLIRGKEFHKLWFHSISKYTNPKKVFICNNNSPILPSYDESVEFTSLNLNAGHATNLVSGHKYCGWTSSILLGLSYVELCDTDYFVYVEQDVLLLGNNIIEHTINKMNENKLNFIFGEPRSSPQPLEVSLFVVKRSFITSLLNKYKSIALDDSELSPEIKLAMCVLNVPNLPNRILKSKYFAYILRKILSNKYFHDFGYGRHKPVNFAEGLLYFQHGSQSEIDDYIKISGYQD